jgi:cytochrome c oxidase cbb3-type subunit 2/cytochrome c oxidase cbb3-type subunit I/II
MSDSGRALRTSYLVASVGGVGFFALSVALLGAWPTRVLRQQTTAMSPEQPLGLTESERRGRVVYGREGCAYCHTQQVRYLHADMARFGAPTLAWETRFDYPQLWGTRRIGPDLAREGGVRPRDWQLAHLFDPRALVPRSVMPAYSHLFDGALDRPRDAALDLVAYLETLGRARELAGPEGEVRARAACADCPDNQLARMAFEGPLNGHPARARRASDAPALPATADRSGGLRLFAEHCVTCHGPRGAGDGPGATGLLPRPANLADHDYTSERLADALWNGVAGTAMPAWRDHPVSDLASLAHVVRALRVAGPDPPVPAPLVELGARTRRTACSVMGSRGAVMDRRAHSCSSRPPTSGASAPAWQRVCARCAGAFPEPPWHLGPTASPTLSSSPWRSTFGPSTTAHPPHYAQRDDHRLRRPGVRRADRRVRRRLADSARPASGRRAAQASISGRSPEV